VCLWGVDPGIFVALTVADSPALSFFSFWFFLVFVSYSSPWTSTPRTTHADIHHRPTTSIDEQ
jgi:hypothetical protein